MRSTWNVEKACARWRLLVLARVSSPSPVPRGTRSQRVPVVGAELIVGFMWRARSRARDGWCLGSWYRRRFHVEHEAAELAQAACARCQLWRVHLRGHAEREGTGDDEVEGAWACGDSIAGVARMTTSACALSGRAWWLARVPRSSQFHVEREGGDARAACACRIARVQTIASPGVEREEGDAGGSGERVPSASPVSAWNEKTAMQAVGACSVHRPFHVEREGSEAGGGRVLSPSAAPHGVGRQ